MRISFVLPALLLVACSGSGPQAIQTIGPTGGTLEADGLILTIPPGALEQETEISIESELVDGQKHYHLGPDGLEFKLPVGVSLPYDPSDPASLILHDSTTHGTELVATSTDAAAARVRGEILGFSDVYLSHSTGFVPPPGSDFRVVAQTTTTIELSWKNNVYTPMTGFILQSVDGLGFHTDAEFAANEQVLRGWSYGRRVGEVVEFSYLDPVGQPGVGRSYRLVPYYERNGVRYRSPTFLAAGFTTPSDRLGLVVSFSGAGAVTYSFTAPSAGGPTQGTMQCPPDCTTDFPANTVVDFVAQPLPGATFIEWSGNCSGTSPTIQLTLIRSTRCIASFSTPSVVSFFVTQGGTTADIGGVQAADARCQSAAMTSTLLTNDARNQTWKAFLGKTCADNNLGDCEIAIERIGADPWINMDGDTIEKAALADGTLRSALIVSEYGQHLTATDDEVATGFGATAVTYDIDGDGMTGTRDAQLKFLIDEHTVGTGFGFPGGSCGNWTVSNSFASTVVGHAAWDAPHAAGAAPPAPNDALGHLNATSSFHRQCDAQSETTSAPSGSVARGAQGWHLYCFAVR